MLEPINIELYKKINLEECLTENIKIMECLTENSEIREYFDEVKNNFLHYAQNRDEIFFWYINLPPREKNFVKEILFREAKNGKDDSMAKSKGCASLVEGICLNENLLTTFISRYGIFMMDYEHNDNCDPFGYIEFENGQSLELCRVIATSGKFYFFVTCDPEFIKYICSVAASERYSMQIFDWLRKKKEDFDYAVRLKIFLEEINNNSKLIEFIRSDNDFYNYKVEYLMDDINKSKDFFNWLLWKKQIFDSIEIRLDKFNKNGEVDSEFLQLIADYYLQELKEALLKFYPNSLRRWIFNWRKLRFEINPLFLFLLNPNLENFVAISDKLISFEDNTISNLVNKLYKIENYLTQITNQNSNINIQEINEFILNSNLFSKLVIIYKDNEIIFYNIKDDGSIETYSLKGKKIVKLFKEYKEYILPYLEEAIKEGNFVAFLTSLQIKLSSIKWWQNKKQEIVNFLPNCYTYLRYSLIKKYGLVSLQPINEINIKNEINSYIFLDKNIDENFDKIYICLAKLKKNHPEIFRNLFSILNRSLNLNNIENFETTITKISFFINDNVSSKLLNKILICRNYITHNVFYLKKSFYNDLTSNDLKNLLKSVLHEDIVDKLNEVKDELFLKFDIKENEIDYFQFTMNFANLKELEQYNFISYITTINHINEFDKKDILLLFNAESLEEFKNSFNIFSIKVMESYNNYFEENYAEINKEISNYSNQINDMKNFIKQVNNLDDKLKESLSIKVDEIKEISSQISNMEDCFNNLSNGLSQTRNTFEDLRRMQKKVKESKNIFQDTSSKTKDLENQVQKNYFIMEENIKNLSNKINELKKSSEKIDNELNNNEEQKKQTSENIKIAKELIDICDVNISSNKNTNEITNKHLIENNNLYFKSSLFFTKLPLLNKLFKNNKVWRNFSQETNEKQNEITKFKNCQREANEQSNFNKVAKKNTEKKLSSFQKEHYEISSKNKELLKQKSEIENQINSYTAKLNQLNDFTNRKEFSDFRDFVKKIPPLDESSNFRTTIQF